MIEAYTSPWLKIVGWGESGIAGLIPASHDALWQAEFVVGASRHLALLPPELPARRCEWPVPFAAGIDDLLALRGRKVVMLASHDPFWFGVGTVLARYLAPHEWTAQPAPSTFSLAAARLGWGLEHVDCLGLHAAPLARVRPHLAPGRRLLVLLRDGAAVGELATLLRDTGFGDTCLHILEALGGPDERIRSCLALRYDERDVRHPVATALEVAGQGAVMPCTGGLDDDFFEHDGQITKRPVRALTLSALAPRPGECLWDIGTGSGSVAIEWLLAHPANQAIGFDANAERLDRARCNADRLGADRLTLVHGRVPDSLHAQPLPAAVFIGGGLSAGLLDRLSEILAAGTRLVANAVTLESESLLSEWQARMGGELLRLELAKAQPLGSRRGWRGSYPIVQWRVTL